MAADKYSGEQLWEVLYELAPVKRPKPPSTLYDVIVDGADLDAVKRYVAGGHDLCQQFAGGHSVALAIKHGDADFVRYFVESSKELDVVHGLLEAGVKRLSESTGEELGVANAVFEYLLQQPFAKTQLASAYLAAAVAGQYTAARSIVDAGLEDEEIRVGANQTARLSEQLDTLGQVEFAALLTGTAVDEAKLLRRERKEQQRNAELKDMLGSAVSFAEQSVLDGDAFESRYRDLIRAIKAGKWDAALAQRESRFGRNAIEFAAAQGFDELVGVILAARPMPAKAAAVANQAAAVAAATWGHLDTLKVLKGAGVAVEATPSGDNSPLSEACRYGHLEIVEYLLDQGADPASGDGSGHDFTLSQLAGGPHREQIVAALNG